jgi:hypothetical protein
VGWEFWLKGKPGNEVLVNDVKKVAPIKPFRKIKLKNLPDKSEKSAFGSHWKPIYKYMEKTPNLNIPIDPKEITADFINTSFDQATEFMKTRVSYIWNLKNREPANWSISTWSKFVSNGYVRNMGTDEDKLHLPKKKEKKATNKKRKSGAKSNNTNKDSTDDNDDSSDDDSTDDDSSDDDSKVDDNERNNNKRSKVSVTTTKNNNQQRLVKQPSLRQQ